jgi:competence ComEA-like helix-hairpin-helix protein
MWKSFERFGRRIGFTSSETAVVFFLAAAMLAGGIIRLFDGRGTRAPGSIAADYEKQDSVFRARSEAVDSMETPVSGTVRMGASDGAGGHGSGKTAPSGIININIASEQQLAKLPGVGPSTARKIISFRTAEGKFRKPEDILKVPTIGPKKFERMKAYITTK